MTNTLTRAGALALLTACTSLGVAQVPNGTVFATTTPALGGPADAIFAVQPGGGLAGMQLPNINFGDGESAFEYLAEPGSREDTILLAVRRGTNIELDLIFLVDNGGGVIFPVQAFAVATIPTNSSADPVDLIREDSGSFLLLFNDGGGPRVFRMSIQASLAVTANYIKELTLPAMLPLPAATSLGLHEDGSFFLTEFPGPFGAPSSYWQIAYDGSSFVQMMAGAGNTALLATRTGTGQDFLGLTGGIFTPNVLCGGAPLAVVINGATPVLSDARHHGKGLNRMTLASASVFAGAVASVDSDCATMATSVTLEFVPPVVLGMDQASRAEPDLFAEYGHAGVSSTGNPFRLNNTAEAVAGTSYTLEMSGLPAGAPIVLSLALAPDSVDLGIIGAPDNRIYTQVDVLSANLTSDAQGNASFTAPLDPGLMGLVFFWQALAVDQGANALGVVASNGVRMIP